MKSTHEPAAQHCRPPPRGNPRRRPPAPIVGTRIAGHVSQRDDDYFCIYFGATSDFGQLHQNSWFRMRTCDRTCRADFWRVLVNACGREIYLDAVMDDFGNLVATSQ